MAYGLFLCIHPAQKKLTLHKLPCMHYKAHLKQGNAKGMYTFHKNCRNIQKLIEKASEWSLEWHAPIMPCKDCFD